MTISHGEKARLRRAIRKNLQMVSILPPGMKTPVMRQVELRFGEPIEFYLVRRLRNGDTELDIANDIGVTEGCISRWIKRLHILVE